MVGLRENSSWSFEVSFRRENLQSMVIGTMPCYLYICNTSCSLQYGNTEPPFQVESYLPVNFCCTSTVLPVLLPCLNQALRNDTVWYRVEWYGQRTGSPYHAALNTSTGIVSCIPASSGGPYECWSQARGRPWGDNTISVIPLFSIPSLTIQHNRSRGTEGKLAGCQLHSLINRNQ